MDLVFVLFFFFNQVFDEVDDMFDHGLGSEIQKLLNLLKESKSSASTQQDLQTILVTSSIKKVCDCVYILCIWCIIRLELFIVARC